MRVHKLCFWMLLVAWYNATVQADMEATWTPNESDANDGGPLPLSTNQRQELLRLEDAIRSSPDPQATLLKVAEANQMDPNDLVNLLNRNRQDMSQGGGGNAPRRSNVWQSLVQVGIMGGQWMIKHPKVATGVGVTLLAGLYTSYTIPRTGLVLSTRKSALWSKGATTLFYPPMEYLERALAQQVASRDLSPVVPPKLYQKVEVPDDEDNESTEPQWTSVPKKSPIRRAITLAATLDVPELRGHKFESIDEEVVLESGWEQGVTVLQQQALTEFCTEGFLRFVTDDPDGLLVVRGLGDWGGYGLVPLRKVSPEELDAEDSMVTLTLNTVQGAHWDGQIHIQLNLEDDSKVMTVRVTLLTPKGGSAPSKGVAKRIVQALHESLVTSIRTRTRQALARQSQSARFQTAAREKAATRRNTRASKERAIEEMTAERRRRWQRGAGRNSGSYRPSGERMRSPNNAVYK